MFLIDVLVDFYSQHPFLGIVRVVGILVSIFIASELSRFAIGRRGKSFGMGLRYLSYSLYVAAHLPLISFLSPLPGFPWNLVYEFVYLIFILMVVLAAKHWAHTIRIHDQLFKR